MADQSFQLYDTTLRDGTQMEGLALTVGDKLALARSLDALGVGFIEGAGPARFRRTPSSSAGHAPNSTSGPPF